jgi:NADPH:quinone reductase-like Zn-dependent oxidoreductase
VIFGPPSLEGGQRCVLEGIALGCGVIETPDPAFDPEAPGNEPLVLVRKRGFALNYRDRPFILGVALQAPAGSFAAVGSEFVGEVVACGAAVEALRPGDRVIGNGAYPDSGVPGVLPGLAGNSQSKELQVVHAAKLLRIPQGLADAVAAGFSVGAQTAFSMIRKLELEPGARVLVTGGRSNTSLFAIHALKALPQVEVCASTTSAFSEERLRALGLAGVVRVDPEAPDFAGGFDAVIDPFADVHMAASIQALRVGGRYVTCGFQDQVSHLVPGTSRASAPPPLKEFLTQLIVKNIRIIGNCLGSTADLQAAIEAHASGRFPVLVDRVFSGGDAAGFLDRTYNAPDRFGKVVYLYR